MDLDAGGNYSEAPATARTGYNRNEIAYRARGWSSGLEVGARKGTDDRSGRPITVWKSRPFVKTSLTRPMTKCSALRACRARTLPGVLPDAVGIASGRIAKEPASGRPVIPAQGITFTVYGSKEGTERIFPNDLLPRIIPVGVAENPERADAANHSAQFISAGHLSRRPNS